MILFVYDGSFEGLLSAIFDSFATKALPVDIVSKDYYQVSLLDEVRHIDTDVVKAERVLKGIDARSDGEGASLVYKLFLSELSRIELHIYHLVWLLIDKNDPGILNNFANQTVLYSAQLVKKIAREVHRMHAFVRFEKATTGTYFALIAPDFNVLPLIGEHFMRRFADQPWTIFDTRRGYGLHYDLETVIFVDKGCLVFDEKCGTLPPDIRDQQETDYQQLWKKYFQSVNIKERVNKKLHLRHMPKRYWKNLVEKQI